MHLPPALRKWGVRFALAVIVASALGYVPGQVLRDDPRSAKLEIQIEQLDVEARGLAAGNAALVREIRALQTEIGAIEGRARSDLGMVYPDEIVLRVDNAPRGTADRRSAP